MILEPFKIPLLMIILTHRNIYKKTNLLADGGILLWSGLVPKKCEIIWIKINYKASLLWTWWCLSWGKSSTGIFFTHWKDVVEFPWPSLISQFRNPTVLYHHFWWTCTHSIKKNTQINNPDLALSTIINRWIMWHLVGKSEFRPLWKPRFLFRQSYMEVSINGGTP